MATFNERFVQLFDERKIKEKSESHSFGFNSLGDYFSRDTTLRLKSTTLKGYYDDTEANPTLKNLKALSEYFHVSVSYLIGESDCRNLDNQSLLENLAPLGFKPDTVDNLLNLNSLPISEKHLYVTALSFLLTNFKENGEHLYSALYHIGKYFTRLFEENRCTVDLSDLTTLLQSTDSKDVSLSLIKNLVFELEQTKREYSIEHFDSYLLNSVMNDLKEVRDVLDIAQEVIFSSMAQTKNDTMLKIELEQAFSNAGSSEIDITLLREKSK